MMKNKVNSSIFGRQRLVLLSLLTWVTPLFAAEHTVTQVNRAFSIDNITVKKGDVVHFPNEDRFFHNIYSLSVIQTFDLGTYPQGESRTVNFDTVGTVLVECAIHPSMKLTVSVEP